MEVSMHTEADSARPADKVNVVEAQQHVLIQLSRKCNRIQRTSKTEHAELIEHLILSVPST